MGATPPAAPTANDFLHVVAKSFADAYGIRVDSALSLLGALAFIVVAAFGWPLLLRLALSVSAKSSTPSQGGSTLAQRLERLEHENRELRAVLHSCSARLDANERLVTEMRAQALAEGKLSSSRKSD